MNENQWLQFLVTLPYVLFLALGGGLANFIMKLNQATEPQPVKTLFIRFLGEMFLSGFAGLTTFLLCREWGCRLTTPPSWLPWQGIWAVMPLVRCPNFMIT